MRISNIAPSDASYKPQANADRTASRKTGSNNQTSNISSDRYQKISINSAHHDDNFSMLKQIEARHMEQNQLATQIRQTDKQHQTVGQQISRMKQALNTIVKNYPPFPPGSEERIAALKNFSTFRKELEQLTFPTFKKSGPMDTHNFSSSYVGMETGSIVVEPGEGKGYVYSVKSVVEKIEFNIPTLSDDASDRDIHETLDSLDKTGTMLNTQRFEQGAEHFFPDDSTFDTSEAGDKSVSLRQLLAENFNGNLTQFPAMLMGFLN